MEAEVKTYLTVGQSQALYAQFVGQVEKNYKHSMVAHYAGYVFMPLFTLIVLNLVVEDTTLRFLISILLVAVSIFNQYQPQADKRSAIIRAVYSLSAVEQYEVYARASADPSDLGKEIAEILMEEEVDAYEGKPSAMVIVTVNCVSLRDKELCGNTFAALVTCPAWGQDTHYLACPRCGHTAQVTVDGSMADSNPDIERLEAVDVRVAKVE